MYGMTASTPQAAVRYGIKKLRAAGHTTTHQAHHYEGIDESRFLSVNGKWYQVFFHYTEKDCAISLVEQHLPPDAVIKPIANEE